MLITVFLTTPFSQYYSLGTTPYLLCCAAGILGATIGVIIGITYLHKTTSWLVTKFRPKDGKAISQVFWMLVGGLSGWFGFVWLALSHFLKHVEPMTVFQFAI